MQKLKVNRQNFLFLDPNHKDPEEIKQKKINRANNKVARKSRRVNRKKSK